MLIITIINCNNSKCNHYSKCNLWQVFVTYCNRIMASVTYCNRIMVWIWQMYWAHCITWCLKGTVSVNSWDQKLQCSIHSGMNKIKMFNILKNYYFTTAGKIKELSQFNTLASNKRQYVPYSWLDKGESGIAIFACKVT